jgi:hypothetical protein
LLAFFLVEGGGWGLLFGDVCVPTVFIERVWVSEDVGVVVGGSSGIVTGDEYVKVNWVCFGKPDEDSEVVAPLRFPLTGVIGSSLGLLSELLVVEVVVVVAVEVVEVVVVVEAVLVVVGKVWSLSIEAGEEG